MDKTVQKKKELKKESKIVYYRRPGTKWALNNYLLKKQMNVPLFKRQIKKKKKENNGRLGRSSQEGQMTAESQET